MPWGFLFRRPVNCYAKTEKTEREGQEKTENPAGIAGFFCFGGKAAVRRGREPGGKKNFLPQPEQEAHTQYTFGFPSNGLWPGG